jgi:hypothetical protein
VEGLAAGRFRPELRDPDMIAQLFMAGMHGIVSLHIARGKDPWVKWRPVRQKARLMVEALIRGLTIPPAEGAGNAPGVIGTIVIPPDKEDQP